MRTITVTFQSDLPDDQMERLADSIDQHLFRLVPDEEFGVTLDRETPRTEAE